MIYVDKILLAAAADPGGGGGASSGIFGTVTSPYVTGYTGDVSGLIFFLTNILRLVFLVAGLFSLIKIVIAGFGYINAGGEPKKIEQAWANIWQALVGLFIIVSSFAIAAIIGQLLFGNATYILSPTLFGVGK